MNERISMSRALLAALTLHLFCAISAQPAYAVDSGLDTPNGVTSLPFSVEGAQIMTLTGTGLGIGVVNPSVALEVNGIVQVGTGAGGVQLNLQDVSGANWFINTGNYVLGFYNSAGSQVLSLCNTGAGCAGNVVANVAGNLKLSGQRSVIFTTGDNSTSDVGGFQFLTYNNGVNTILTPTDQNGNPVNSTLDLGGFGNYNSNTVSLAVSGALAVGIATSDSWLEVNGNAHIGNDLILTRTDGFNTGSIVVDNNVTTAIALQKQGGGAINNIYLVGNAVNISNNSNTAQLCLNGSCTTTLPTAPTITQYNNIGGSMVVGPYTLCVLSQVSGYGNCSQGATINSGSPGAYYWTLYRSGQCNETSAICY